MWKTELLLDELIHLAEDIPQQNVEGAALVLLAAHSKVQGERDTLSEELFIKKKLRLKDMGNSQPIPIAKDVKIRRFILRKVCSA